MEIYFDHAATTFCDADAAAVVQQVMVVDYGNPSSLHRKGLAAEHHIKAAKEALAKILKVQEKELYFTSGGTESNNLAIIGAALAHRRSGNHIITSAIEHPAVLAACEHLATEQGMEVTYIPVNQAGQVCMDALKAALRPETILVSIMHVNNEVGAIQPVAAIGALIKAYNQNIIYHVDSVQGFGKFEIFPTKAQIDLLSASAHKIHGPKGVGLLYMKDKTKLQPLFFGGQQQKNIRSGTENVPGIAGFGVAAKKCFQNRDEHYAFVSTLRDYFVAQLQSLGNVEVHSGSTNPYIISVAIKGIKAEVLLHALGDQGIYISSGSACASNHPAISGVLKAMGVAKDGLESTLRFSLDPSNTIAEIEQTMLLLRQQVPLLRRFTRR